MTKRKKTFNILPKCAILNTRFYWNSDIQFVAMNYFFFGHELIKIKGRQGGREGGRECRFFINWVIRKQIWKLTKEWRRDGASNKSANAVHWRKACFLSSLSPNLPHHVPLSCHLWVCHIHDYNNWLATPTLPLCLSLSLSLAPSAHPISSSN